VEMLHRMKPAAEPQRARPPRLDSFDETRRLICRDRPGGLEAPLHQVPYYCEATLSARTLGGRQGSEPFTTSDTGAPDTEDPVLLPQRRSGSYTVSMHREAMANPLMSRVRQASYSWGKRSGRSRTALFETTHWPSAFSKAPSMSRWDIPPADISTIMRGSASLVRSSAAHNVDR
jgi:hypothetical protein